MNWSPEKLDRLERAIMEGGRVQIDRRGTEYVLVAHTLRTEGPVETLVGRHPTTGEDMEFRLDEIDSFAVVD